MQGLPPESATWRKVAFPPAEEFLAALLERQDAWSGAQIALMCGQKRVPIPAQVQILRPGEEPPKSRIESDPRKIAEFLSGGRG